MVEGARLESVYTGNGIAGSNPAPSATSIIRVNDLMSLFAWWRERAPQNTPHFELAFTGSTWT